VKGRDGRPDVNVINSVVGGRARSNDKYKNNARAIGGDVSDGSSGGRPCCPESTTRRDEGLWTTEPGGMELKTAWLRAAYTAIDERAEHTRRENARNSAPTINTAAFVECGAAPVRQRRRG